METGLLGSVGVLRTDLPWLSFVPGATVCVCFSFFPDFLAAEVTPLLHSSRSLTMCLCFPAVNPERAGAQLGTATEVKCLHRRPRHCFDLRATSWGKTATQSLRSGRSSGGGEQGYCSLGSLGKMQAIKSGCLSLPCSSLLGSLTHLHPHLHLVPGLP